MANPALTPRRWTHLLYESWAHQLVVAPLIGAPKRTATGPHDEQIVQEATLVIGAR